MDYKEALIAMLNKAYENETKAFRGYMFAAVSVVGPLHDLYEKVYKEFAEKEKEHIYEIGEKITALGGKVSTNCLPITEVEKAASEGYKAVLTAQRKVEQETIDMYVKMHEFTSKHDDTPTVLLIEHILQEEQEHHDELERILLDTKQNMVKEEKNKSMNNKIGILSKRAHTNKEMEELFRALRKIFLKLHEIETSYDNIAYAYLDPEFRKVNKYKKAVEDKLDGLDPNWRGDFFNENQAEQAKMMKNYANINFVERQRRLLKIATQEEKGKRLNELFEELQNVRNRIANLVNMYNEDGTLALIESDPEFYRLARQQEIIKTQLEFVDKDWKNNYTGFLNKKYDEALEKFKRVSN